MRLPSRGSDSEEGFGRQPMALRRAFGAAFLEPQEIGKLTDAIVAISHCRPRLELAARAASRLRVAAAFLAAADRQGGSKQVTASFRALPA
jgi:hypothetical protein